MQAFRFAFILLLIMAGLSWTGVSIAAIGPAVNQPAPNAVFTTQSRRYSVAQFKGHKVMLWLLSTWCTSCQEGLHVLAQERAKLRKAGVTVIVLENYRNGGYGGESITTFAQRYGASVLHSSNWLFGDAPQPFSAVYNPHNFADIYYLIDTNGVIHTVSSAPSATLDEILDFADGRCQCRPKSTYK